jgi:hypothetical protein
LTLFSAAIADGASSTVYPAYGQYVLAQFSKGGTFTTGTVTVEGRVSSDFAWVILATFTEATAAADMAAIVARFPEMRGLIDSLTGTGAAVTLALAQTDQPRP